jgi:hypothetical protein
MKGACAGLWNRRLGWGLLVAGFAAAVWLDPWSLAQRDTTAIAGSTRMVIRHVQAVVLGMAFLQLLLATLVGGLAFTNRSARIASGLSVVGALLYTTGYAVQEFWPPAGWLIVAGALVNGLAFAVLVRGHSPEPGRRGLEVLLVVLGCGMLLDAVMGFFSIDPPRLQPAYLGGEDGVRLRMLRLARAAVIALSLLAILYRELEKQSGGGRLAYWGGVVLVAGAVGMPLFLTLAAFVAVEIKYLLCLPAQAVFWGTLAGVWLAWRRAGPLEAWGWLLIAVSMQAGLLMGLYAFDGPFPSPDFLGDYNDWPRRLSRLGHAYCILLGLLSIFLSREMEQGQHPAIRRRLGVPLLMTGSTVTVVVIALLPSSGWPTETLTVGPVLVTAALLLCLVPAERPGVTSASCEVPDRM